MRISHIEIHNFRNFQYLKLDLGPHAVIVGENKIGKSNLIHALRLVLDSRMSDMDRRLRLEDFWDGLPRPLTKDDCIRISVDLSDFEGREDLVAVLAEHLVQPEPMISRLTYLFRPLPTLTNPPTKESDYEFIVYGGDREDNRFGDNLRRWIPLNVLPALRNAEEDLANWRQSPLAPLLRAVAAGIDRDNLDQVAAEMATVTSRITNLTDIKQLAQRIQERLVRMVGPRHAVKTTLGFSPTDPDRLLRSLRLMIDGGVRNIADASLGTANLIYLSLLALELERQVVEGDRSHTFLAIEEPEAHLHPHLQRLAFRDFLRPRSAGGKVESVEYAETIILTTHSPHVVSVSPLKSIVILRKSKDLKSTVGVSTANLALDDYTVRDLERYLDVNRGEMVFAKGVLLVEGPAEEFVLPVLGKLLGYDFDQLGITVCSVDGTNFEPYVQFLGPNSLNMPFAVITDLDPRDSSKGNAGEPRVLTLLRLLIDKYDQKTKEQLLTDASKYGIFLGEHTLEVDLFRSGHHKAVCDTLIALTTNNAATRRAQVLRDDPGSLDPEQLLKDILDVGKGRFAQRLALNLQGKSSPAYIRKAIKYVADSVT